MRLLVLNPNTSAAVTDLVAERVAAVIGDAAEIVPATARFGATYIAGRAALAIAGHAALDLMAERAAGCDAALLACFGDPGLLALREVAPMPVVGLMEAACLAARARAGRYGIVTGGAAWGPMLREIAAGLGIGDELVSIRTVERTGGEIARDPEAALPDLLAACRACAEREGAGAVILGGAALAGLADRLRPGLPVPVLCSVEEGARAALAAARAGRIAGARAVVETTGLAPGLAAWLADARRA